MMEIFELINKILEEKKISKREFAQKLIALEPKSNRTGETISENIVYSCLSGHTAIKAYLIPYISDVLGVPEQVFFEENKKTRMRLLKYLLKNLSKEEENYIKIALNKNKNEDIQSEILELLKYAPQPMLVKIKNSLKEIKNITLNL